MTMDFFRFHVAFGKPRAVGTMQQSPTPAQPSEINYFFAGADFPADAAPAM